MNRFISAIFCDDIRMEVGNKLSMIGVYNGVMLVPAFPITLPKLCIALSARTDGRNPFKQLVFRVLKGEELLVEVPIPIEAFPEIQVPLAGDVAINPNDRLQVCNGNIVISPFVVDKPTTIRVRAIADGEELKALALTIVQQPVQ